jgi:hypothetical protein
VKRDPELQRPECRGAGSQRDNVPRLRKRRGKSVCDDLMDRSGAEIDKVELTLVAFGKRCYLQAGVPKLIGVHTLSAFGSDSPDAAGSEIAEDVETL